MLNNQNRLYFLLITLCSTLLQSNVYGQAPIIDGYFQGKGNASIAVGYAFNSFDSFFAGEEEVDPVPAHEEIEQSIINLYASYGILDNLDVTATLPYIFAQSAAGPDPVNGLTEDDAFQDLTVNLKWSPLQSKFGNGYVSYQAALGFSTPIGDYAENGILSIGNGASAVNATLLTHIQLNAGFFATFSAGYSFRGQADDFDVPNAAMLGAKLGYAGKKFYVDVWSDSQFSESDAVDISSEAFMGNFPETRVDWLRLGANAYYSIVPAFGLTAGFGTVLDGRNVGKSTYYTGGVVFKID